MRAAITSMASKVVADCKEYIADIAVEAMLEVAEEKGNTYKVDVEDVKVEKKTGESLRDTSLIKGIVLDKEIVHSGMPKRVEKAKIALLDTSLEIKKTEFDAKINIERPEQIDSFLREEENMLKEMVEKIARAKTTWSSTSLLGKGFSPCGELRSWTWRSWLRPPEEKWSPT